MTCLVGAGVLAGATFASVDTASARSKHRLHKTVAHKVIANRTASIRRDAPFPASTFTGAANYASLVVDAKTGRVLFEKNADARRYPASVTKVMTLYLVFEDLERGRISLNSDITMSAHCAAEAPSKLGLRPGRTIDVENGIKSLVTKSANDVACAFAENIEGSVPAWADRMTRKARALGMYGSNFRNASGLPDPNHYTTARDLVTLGRAIQDRFPRYYGYFGTRVFYYAGRPIPNHNHLLGRVEGMDGIKTGYTNASGFNLLSSVKQGGRSIVAVVMGGRTGPSRDAHMRELIALNLPKAQPGSRTAPMVAESGESPAPARARPAVMTAGFPAPLAAPVVAAPIRIAALDVPVPPRAPQAPEPEAILAPAPVLPPVAAPVSSGMTPKATPRVAAVDQEPYAASPQPSTTTTPKPMRWVVGAAPSVTGSVASSDADATADADDDASPALPPARPVRVASNARDFDPSPKRAPAVAPTAIHKGWIIQIGATTEAGAAQALLAEARSKGGQALASADPFTEPFVKGDTTYYRARFAGLNERTADAACKQLKRSSVSCFTIKN